MIIGGVGTVLGSFLGAAFVTLLPVLSAPACFWTAPWDCMCPRGFQLELMVFGDSSSFSSSSSRMGWLKL